MGFILKNQKSLTFVKMLNKVKIYRRSNNVFHIENKGGYMNLYAINTSHASLAWNAIKKATKITFLTHYKPDGDGISACAALSSLFEEMDKQCETIYPTASDFSIARTPRKELIMSHTQLPDLIIACDTANYARLYYPKEFLEIPLINIDHHIANELRGDFNFVNADASSTCEIVYELMTLWHNSSINQWQASALLYGILYDTQVFQTTSTTDKTLKIAAMLMDHGASLTQLKDELLKTKSLHVIQLWGTILSGVQITNSGHAAWVCLTQEMLKSYNVELSSLAGFVNFLASISSVDVTALFYETEDGKTKVSLRSRTRNVNALAQQFGGGGHKNAAGIISNKPMNEIVELVTRQL